MRSTKSIILIVIALGCGLIASIGISQVMDRPATTAAETESIFVAASNIPNWSALTPDLVKQEEWPKGKVPPDAIRTLEELEGKSPKYPLYPGEPIVLSKLTDETDGQASVRIPPGHQVFAVKVDKESALSGLISPGDKVDILVFIRGRGGADRLKTGTRTILRNTTVFAVNDQIERQGDETSIDAKTVSLLVLPDQSEKLLLAKQLGTIHLALRKPGDDSSMDTDGADEGDLDDSSDGSDGMIAKDEEKKPQGGIFGILDGMKNAGSMAVDTSNATQAQGPSTTMTIMSPDGVLGTYTFAGNSQKDGGLPPLPTELVDDADGDKAPADGNDLDTDLLDSDGDTDAGDDLIPSDDGDITDSDDVGVLDPADLGL